MHQIQQLLAGSRDAGSDRADRDVEQFGRLLVSESVQLGEDERRPSVVIESVEQLVDLGLLGHRGRVDVIIDRELAHPQAQPTLALTAPRRVGTRASRDREQPMLGRPGGPVPMERGDRTLVGLLSEVIGVVPVAEVAAQFDDVAVRRGDEPIECGTVAVLRVEQQPGQVIHAK